MNPTPATLAKARPDAHRTIGPALLCRGDVWYVRADPEHPSTGAEIWPERPAVIISTNIVNSVTGCVSVVFLARQGETLRNGQVPIAATGDLRHDSVAVCTQVHSLDRNRLVKRLTSVKDEELEAISTTLGQTLGLD